MPKIKSLFIAAAAVTVATMTTTLSCAQEYAGNGSTTAPVAATFSSPPIVDGNQMTTDCNACATDCGQNRFGNGPRMEEWKRKHAHHKALAHRVIARNQAWPMPFNCADRQLYFALWEPMIDQGFEEQCVLTSAHFDPETGELNSFGVHAVAGIIQNMPTSRRKVFIHRDVNDEANAMRMDAVKKTIATYYGQSGPATVEFSTKLPVKLSGIKADSISRLWADNQPSPVIPISSGGDSVANSIGN